MGRVRTCLEYGVNDIEVEARTQARGSLARVLRLANATFVPLRGTTPSARRDRASSATTLACEETQRPLQSHQPMEPSREAHSSARGLREEMDPGSRTVRRRMATSTYEDERTKAPRCQATCHTRDVLFEGSTRALWAMCAAPRVGLKPWRPMRSRASAQANRGEFA